MSRLTQIAAFSTAAAVAAALAGCSGGASGTASGDGGGDVTISYSNFISNGGNEENLDAIVAAFEDENPGIIVDVATLPYADYFTTLQTDLAAGTQADVFDIEYANFGTYVADGVIAPLEDVDTSVYRTSLADAYSSDGAQYALPSSFSNVVLFYNSDLFDAAGLDYPTSDWTWEDEKVAAEQLTDEAAGVYGDYQPISYYEYYKAVAQAGGDFLADDGISVAFDSPEGIAAAEWLVGKSGTVMPTPEQGAGTPDYDSGLFLDGKLAMWHSGIWMFGALADATFNWDIAVEPGDAQKASALFSNAVAVSSSSDEKEAAQAFAEFLTSSSTMVETRLDAGWELPPVSDDSLLASYLGKGAPANRQAVFDALENVALPPIVAEGQTEMQDIVSEELTEAAAGRKSVEEAVSSAAERVNAVIG
ncbi:ABC transporter substrate-binding protein [Marisediminicola antarctica]|uniref:ABC transporter n=1 Tax=Marisediminicola antarctica TaxID=674079 RepID=A0A7L5AIY5_9MICO|nr:sugar ABC transporter substrate-binding protein [Marisediminicola antarctica]QHO70287.1 ABC transporter [Marisediminicola antarctica]